MNYLKCILGLLLGLLSITVCAKIQTILPINTQDTSMVYGVNESNKLQFLYYGKRLNSFDNFSELHMVNKPDTNRTFQSPAIPTFGADGFMNEPMLRVTHADGGMSTDLVYVGHQVNNQDNNVSVMKVKLRDPNYPFFVTLKITAYLKENIVSQQTIIEHSEKGDIELQSFYSGYLALKSQAYHLTHFHGAWAGEMKLSEEKLTQGIKSIESKKGVRTTQTENSSFLLSLGQTSTEDTGEVIGGALAWSGNYKINFEVDEYKNLNLLAGMNPFASQYTLASNDIFETPALILSYSAQGQGKISRNFHSWARRYSLMHGDQERPIVLNSWEGAYFSFDQATITEMIDDAADLGVEMFVLDDGWFGNKYPRNSDKAGLGDWQVNQSKLPNGINFLAEHANKKGLQFGIWIEPEMVNQDSELAKNHPDWIVQRPGRKLLEWRNQLSLDLSNPDVQAYVYSVVDDLMQSVPNIAYIKWDANRHIENIGSNYLAKDKQSHFWIDYTKGLYSVYEKIRAKYPNLLMQACASGGGRLDFGSLAYHDEFWASDNTDPMARVSLQYATNLIYPAIATGSHISTSPNHQTKQPSSLKFRADVAMTGRLGMELLQDENRTFIKKALLTYKNIRKIIQFGDLYRMHTPIDGSGWTSLAYVGSEDAVMFLFSTRHHDRGIYPTVKLKGLDAKANYRITELNKGDKTCWVDQKVFSGEYLMNVGLNFDVRFAYDSLVLKLTKVN